MSFKVVISELKKDGDNWVETGRNLSVCVDIDEEPSDFIMRWVTILGTTSDGKVYGRTEYDDVVFVFTVLDDVNCKPVDIDKAVMLIDKFISDVKWRREKWIIDVYSDGFVLRRKGVTIPFDAIRYNWLLNIYDFIKYDVDWNEDVVCSALGHMTTFEGLDDVKKMGKFFVVG